MNVKKTLVAALAVMTAAVSVSAVTASAVGKLGQSTQDVSFNVTAGEDATVTATLDGTVGMTLDVTAYLPAGSFTDGTYGFHAELVADQELEDAFVASLALSADQQLDYFDILDISFTTELGEGISPKRDVTLSFKTSKASAYNNVYIYNEDGTFTLIGDMDEALPPHFSRFVIAAISDRQPSEIEVDPTTSQTSNTPSQTSTTPSQVTPGQQDVKTGDNGAATAVVFAVMAMAALGTSVVAVKAKKASK